MGLSIIIPTHNRKKNLLKLIKQLSQVTTDLHSEIIVVNDVQSDDLQELMPANVNYLVNSKGGVAASRNLGAEKAKYDHLLFIDDDMLVTSEAIIYANKFLETNSNSILNINWVYPAELVEECKRSKFGRYLINTKQVSLEGWMGTGWQKDQKYVVSSMASPFLAIHKSDFEKIGGYNELFPFARFVDYDFSRRITENGIEIVLDTNFTIFHNEEENIEKLNWLKRRYRNSYTRGIGVSKLQIREMEFRYSGIKRILFSLIYFSRTPYSAVLDSLPNSSLFDGLYTALANRLLGAYLFKGYKDGTELK